MAKVAIVGAGNVGATLAHDLMRKGTAHVALIDNLAGRAQGKALDIAQAASILGSRTALSGSTEYDIMEGADIVIITAGLTRKEGASREDLLLLNADIVRAVVAQAHRRAPDAILIMVTNPLDAMCHVAAERYPVERIVGLSGVLDGSRLASAISETLDADVRDIEPLVIGNHGPEMVPLLRLTTVGGMPLPELASGEQQAIIKKLTAEGGARFSTLMGTSAYHAPAVAITKMIDAILDGHEQPLICSAHLSGEYGIEGVFVGVPVLLGPEGVRGVVELDLDEHELLALRKAAEHIKELAQQAGNNRPATH